MRPLWQGSRSTASRLRPRSHGTGNVRPAFLWSGDPHPLHQQYYYGQTNEARFSTVSTPIHNQRRRGGPPQSSSSSSPPNQQIHGQLQQQHVPFRQTLFQDNRDDSLRPLRSKTTALLETPIGSWTTTQRQDANQLLHLWTDGASAVRGGAKRQPPKQQQQQNDGTFTFSETSESVLRSFQLLERLLVELRRRSSQITGDAPTVETTTTTTTTTTTPLKPARNEWMFQIDPQVLDALIRNWSSVWQDLHKTNTKRQTKKQQLRASWTDNTMVPTSKVNIKSYENSIIEDKPATSSRITIGDAESSAKLLLELTPENVLSRLDAYRARSSGILVPSMVTYEAILTAAAASKTPLVGVKILDRLQKQEPKSDNICVDSKVYDRFFKICSSERDAAQAESILEHLLETQDDNLRPSARNFHQTLVALVRDDTDNFRHAKDKSLSLLQRMKDLSAPGAPLQGVAQPDRFTYNLVLRCMSHWIVSSLLDDYDPVHFAKIKDYESDGEIALNLFKEMKSGGKRTMPDTETYGLVLSILRHLAKAELCESLLEQMYEDFSVNKNKTVEPNTAIFNSVLAAWTKHQKAHRANSTTVETSGGLGGKEYSSATPLRAESILRKMQELSGELKNAKPDGATYRHIIQCWADSRIPDAGDRAMAILKEAEEIQKETGEKMLVDASYSFVVKAFAGNGQAAKAEQAVLEFHRQYSEDGIEEAKPSKQQLQFLISSWGKSNHPDAPRRAKLILEEFQKLYENGQFDLPPDVVSYNAVIECYSRSNHPRATEDAMELLLEMKKRSKNGEKHLTPTYLSYFHVMKVFANSGNASKAEDLFENMLEDYRRHGKNANQFHDKVLNCVITAYVNSKAPDAPHRAVAFLERTQQLYDRGRLPCKPNVVSYTLALKCFAECNHRDPDTGKHMEKLIDVMEERAANGDAAVAPNTMTYSTVIQHYGRVGEPEKAEALLERMYQRYQHGNHEAKPNKRTFTSVLLAWSRSHRDNPAERALAILDWMKNLHQSGVLDDVKPNKINYTAVLSSLARSDEVNGQDPRKVVISLLIEMEEQAADGDEDARPNVVAYNSALQTFSARGDGPGAQKLLARMVYHHQMGLLLEKPDLVSWNSVLEAWSMSEDPRAAIRADAVLDRLKKLQKSGEVKDPPNMFTYASMVNTYLSKSELPQARKRIASLLDELEHVAEMGNDDSISMYDHFNVIRNLCKTEDFDLLIRAERVLRRMIRPKNANAKDRNTNAIIASFRVLIKAWKNSDFTLAAEHAAGLQRELNALGYDFSKRREGTNLGASTGQLRTFSSSATAEPTEEAEGKSKINYSKYQPRPWEDYYEALKGFKEEHNHCNVPQKYKSDPSLAYFVSKQRRHRDSLSPEQKRLLDDLGFDWTTRTERYERQWDDKLQLLLAYKAECDTLNVPRRSTFGDGSLGAWVDKQRVLKKQGLLPEERQKRLDAIGFEWTLTVAHARKTSTHDKKWRKKYDQLADFYRQHGHCMIPARYGKDLSLGNWIVAQRSLNRKGLLREDRKEMLEAIDFLFEIDNTDPTVSPNQQRWEENFELLLKYKQQNGHLHVPHREGKLGEWVATQKKAEKDGTLDDSRRERLLQAGFQFPKSREEKWQEQYQKLQHFHQQHGHAMVPSTGEDSTLSNWVFIQRTAYKEGKLSMERQRLLEALDFVWRIRNRQT